MGNYNFDLDLTSDNTMSVISSWIKDETDVLEFGCANGRLTKYLSEEKKCHMTIVEMDEEAGIEAAQYAECSYLGKDTGDINRLYWTNDEKKYDYIIFADVLEHLPDPQTILNKCKEKLKKSGEILVSIPNISHNSILIDLFNDRFFYEDVGLLDKTHIHFFTYHSFSSMIRQIGLYIHKQFTVYSRVGWNEIENSYSDVPFCIERELRKRRCGSVYQYVFCLSEKKPEIEMSFDSVLPLEEDMTDQEEGSCYFWRNAQLSDDFIRRGKVYARNGRINICFTINSKVEKLRIDPLEHSALIVVDKILVKAKGQEPENVQIFKCNAEMFMKNIFLFKDEDPYWEINIKQFADIELEYVEIIFEVLDVRLDKSQLKIYNDLLKNRIIDEQKELYNNWEYIKEYSRSLEKDVKIQSEYIEHLEKDIAVQKDYIIHLEKDIKIQKEYIEHLEKDIRELQENIKKDR